MVNTLKTGFYLSLAIFLEVAGITSMKFSNGFKNIEPSIFIFIFYALSFLFLALTLKRLEVSLAYAIWSGVGTLLIVVIGACFFHEPLTWVKVLSLSAIIIGVVSLKAAK